MKKIEKKPVPSFHHEVVEFSCDLCGKIAEFPHSEQWSKDGWTEEITAIEYEVRHSSGYDGGWGEIIRVDLCPDCFKTKLIPWLESQGVTPTKTDLDW